MFWLGGCSLKCTTSNAASSYFNPDEEEESNFDDAINGDKDIEDENL
jgi:hypothetical protein